jgi:hypothetical protein
VAHSARTLDWRARVPRDMADAARAAIGRPNATPTELIRFALAKLANLPDPDGYAAHRPAGRPPGAKDLRPRKNARKERQPA